MITLTYLVQHDNNTLSNMRDNIKYLNNALNQLTLNNKAKNERKIVCLSIENCTFKQEK